MKYVRCLLVFLLWRSILKAEQAYISDNNDTISIINVTTETITNTIATGDFPSSIAFSSDNKKAYVANFTDHNGRTDTSYSYYIVSVNNTGSETFIGSITMTCP